ncbi:hypothetical protein [Haliovirga abyssi]|uniref:DUF2993 domain-containing protein n=1 Tax=Haliovirga abyssi TaxID=2996794 RepID=A0AAU9DEK0_9FUSO|nr:hypothetical protein [Haliovirga abyssi]BDU49762.1 hypothetical protein HLVA_03310 [Haliovirga abyssi]
MKKIFVLFIILCNLIVAQDYNKAVMENKNIKSIEQKQITEQEISLIGVNVDGIRVDKIYTNLLSQKSEVVILKKDLETAFLAKNKDIKEINLTIGKDKLIAKGKVSLLGIIMSVYLEGEFILNDNQELEFDIKKAKVNGIIGVPKKIIEGFKKRLNPIFKLKKFGIPLYVSKIIFEKDKIKFI